MNALTQISDAAVTVVAVLLIVHVIALVVVNMTATPKDDEALARVYPMIERLAGLITKKSKE